MGKLRHLAVGLPDVFLVYYLGHDLDLIDPEVADLAPWQAITISVGSLVFGWIAYDLICKSRFGDDNTRLMLGLYVILVAMAWGYTQVFTGRAALLHLGAFTATIMSANVFMIIIPNQKIVVADLIVGRKPDPKYGKIAKQRSTHNNYLTLPVLFLMLSNHYPLVFATEWNWLIASLVFLMGVTIRHWFNSQHARTGSPYWAWAATAILFILIAWLSTAPMRHLPAGDEGAALDGPALSYAAAEGFDDVVTIVQGRCSMCHAAEPGWEGVHWPPKDVVLETPAQIAREAKRIYLQTGLSHAMPPANVSYMEPLALYDPGEPSAVDLRLILAGILAQSPATMGRALEHARIVLQARGDDPRAIQLMAGLLERSQLPAEAADILERLAARERDPDRLHDLYMQRAKLLADVPGREAQALAAIEKAAELGPGNRTTILFLIRLLERSGQVDRVATYLDPIRAAMLASIGRGTVAPTDIRMLAEVAARPNPPLAQMARVLCYAIEPNSAPPPDGHMRAASGPGLQNVLATPALRQMLLAPAESADISDLLACVESAMDRMYVEFVGLGPDEIVPVPANVDVQGLAFPLRAWGRLLGIEELILRASSINNAVALLDEGDDPTLRLGVNLWIRGYLIAWRGLAALPLARRALGGGKVRSLVPVELDLMLAASFEVTKVFNAITADPDTRRLRDLTNNLGKNLPRRQRRPLLRICQALSSTHFEPAATARATLSTDLRMALLLSGDVSGCLAAACLLDGFANGSLKQRISLSRTAQELAVFMLSDAYLALRRQIVS